MSPNLSIGILAHNEAGNIAGAISALFQQTLVRDPEIAGPREIIVVANGCQDGTARVAEEALKELGGPLSAAGLTWRVVNVQEAGKSNAWNVFVHELSANSAQYLFLMDADISFLGGGTLEAMLLALQGSPKAWVVVDEPVKSIAFKAKKSFFDRLSLRVSQRSGTDELGICGQLYGARATALRWITMPVGLPVEDGFLRAMVLTEGFSRPDEVHAHLVKADGAAHVYEPYGTVPSLIAHEKRLVIGTTINYYIYEWLRERRCSCPEESGMLIRRMNKESPMWLHEVLRQAWARRRWWLLPRGFVFRRFHAIAKGPLRRALARLPVVLVAFAADAVICLQANLALRRGVGIGYWREAAERTDRHAD